MIKALIFSKDRCMQLDLLLRSIKLNAPDVFDISILYKASNDSFKEGYIKLIKEEILPNITWIEESDFKPQVLEFLEHDNKFTCFFTDDDVLYNKIDVIKIVETLENDSDSVCFSLRLGCNISWCYTMNASNILGDYEEKNGIIRWHWPTRYLDVGYPFSLDGHIFRTIDITKLIKKINFHNPNTLEGNLQIFDNYPKEFISAFKNSVLVNSPSNIVNETHPNRKGEEYGISTEELNRKYLEGEIIDFETIDFSGINSPHKELKFIFKK